MLPRRAKVNLGAMAMKRCSAFPKAPASLEPPHRIVWSHIQDTHWRGGVLTVGLFYSPSWLGNTHFGLGFISLFNGRELWSVYFGFIACHIACHICFIACHIGYLMPNPLCRYISNISDLFGWVKKYQPMWAT